MMLVPRKNNFGLDLFEEFFDDPFFRGTRMASPAQMKTDIKENEKDYSLAIDIPGFEKEDIKVELKNGYLTVGAERNESKEEKNDKNGYIHRERHYGSVQRSFYVGDAVTEKDIKASYKNGTLNVTLPKKDAKQVESGKHIAIE